MSAPSASLQHAAPNPELTTAQTWPVMSATLLGLLIILAVGFAPGIAHNAAHDTRHTLVFPCH